MEAKASCTICWYALWSKPNWEDQNVLLLVTILKNYHDVESLMLAFLEFGITGSTIIEGKGMGTVLAQQPLLQTMNDLFPGADKSSYVVISVGQKDNIKRCEKWANNAFRLNDSPASGILFTIALNDVFGIANNVSSGETLSDNTVT